MTMSSEPAIAHVPKRRRIERSPSPQYRLDDEANDNYVPYVPVAQRRQAKLAQLTAAAGGESSDRARAVKEKLEREEREDAEREEERTREKARQERTLLVEAQEVHERKRVEDAKKTVDERADEADAEILAAIASRRKLASDLELAQGIQYTETIKTSCVLITRSSDYLFTFIKDGDHLALYGNALRKRTSASGKNTISSLMERTFLHPSTTSLLVFAQVMPPIIAEDLRAGHEDTPNSPRPPQVKTHPRTDAHSDPGYTRRILRPRHDRHRIHGLGQDAGLLSPAAHVRPRGGDAAPVYAW
jgi:hypothetical protein